jgi:quercetin dioxygenase-like cupin family protein
MIYVLKGWLKVSFEGQEPQIMRAGTCWTQPPGIKHAVLDYSDDFEALEVLLPADFETVTVAS